MRYKTTIEIVTEAKDKSEALEIAGDYLAGNLASGVDMRFSAKPAIYGALKVAGAVTVSAMVMIALVALPQVRQTSNMGQTGPAVSAIQPPLKTSAAAKLSAGFKKEWQVRQTAEALSVIRQ